MVAMLTSLSFRVSAIPALCQLTTQTPSITNHLVAMVHTKPVIAILVPKFVAMATSLESLDLSYAFIGQLDFENPPLEMNQAASC